MRPTYLEKTDPMFADDLRRQGGSALRAAVGAKKCAAGLGITMRRARQLFAGDRTSAISRFLCVLASIALVGGSPAPLIVLVQSVAMQCLLRGLTDDQLVQRFWAVMGRESVLEGIENKRVALLADSGNLAGLAEADEAEAVASIERAAIARELMRRRISPQSLMMMGLAPAV